MLALTTAAAAAPAPAPVVEAQHGQSLQGEVVSQLVEQRVGTVGALRADI